MKIKLSGWYRFSTLMVVTPMLLVEIWFVHILIRDLYWKTWGDLYIDLIMMILGGCLIALMIFLRPNYLMTMEIQGRTMRSYLFGKLQCEVNAEKEVYYKVFECIERHTMVGTYLAVSNENFVCEPFKKTFWSCKSFIDSHDMKKIIIFPYDEKKKPIFPIDQWTEIFE